MKPAHEYRHDFNRSFLEQWQYDHDKEITKKLMTFFVLISTFLVAFGGLLCLI